MTRFRTLLVVVVLLSVAACSAADSAPDTDTSSNADVGADVADVADVASADISPSDFAIADVQTLDMSDLGMASDVSPSGFGAISGSCAVLDTELTSPETFFIANALDFGSDPYDDTDAARLTDGGREIIADGNAGGNSLLSEVFSFEILARCEGAVLLKTETEVTYQNSMGKITDLLVEIDGLKIGVSVTRAVAFPFADPYSEAQASVLLTDKLSDVLLSSANVTPADAWTKQILHVLAYSPMHAESLRSAYDALEPAITADTIVLVTVTDGDDAPLY